MARCLARWSRQLGAPGGYARRLLGSTHHYQYGFWLGLEGDDVHVLKQGVVMIITSLTVLRAVGKRSCGQSSGAAQHADSKECNCKVLHRDAFVLSLGETVSNKSELEIYLSLVELLHKVYGSSL